MLTNEVTKSFSMYTWKQLEERNVGYGDRSLFLPGGGFTKCLYNDWCVPKTLFMI